MASATGPSNQPLANPLMRALSKAPSVWSGFCCLLICTHALTGVFGRDPWKADEPYSFGIALNFVLGQHARDWIVPHIGTAPFVEKSPLMYWTAALFAQWTSAVLPLQTGFQLAVPFWIAVTLVALWFIARRMDHSVCGLRACMLALGTVGAFGHTQKLIADLPQCAGATIALAALTHFITTPERRSVVFSGVLLGTGIGIAFMSKGVLISGVFVLICAVSMIVLPIFRSLRGAAFFATAIISALPWLLIWPILFWRASAPLFNEWFWDNNFGRFLGFSDIAEARAQYWGEIGLALILTFPAGWLAAAHTLTRWRKRLPPQPVRTMLWLYTAVFFGVVLFASASFREVYLLPVYPALALLGAGVHIPEKIDRGCKRFSILLFSLLGIVLWFCWGALLSEHGQMLPALINRWLPLGYTMEWNTAWLALSLALSGLWLCAVFWRAHGDAITVGFAGLTLVWGLLHTLLLPWLNEARSYRTSFYQLQAALPIRYNCLATLNVGESEQAMLHYFIGIRPVAKKIPAQIPCQVFLVLDKAGERIPTLSEKQWREIWRGGRMGDDNERFRAYIRKGEAC